MIVKYVKLLNIRSYLSEQIYIPNGSVLLSGDIGSGKSTILFAIEFALFGVVRGGVDGASLLRHGKNTGYVEVCFNLDGHEIIIHRALRRNKTSVSQSAGYIVIDGVKTDRTPVELKAKVLDLLGYPKNLLTKSKALIYRYTVYTPQEEMKYILFEDASARLDTLRKVFQIDSYKLIRDNASMMLHLMKERIAELSAKTEDINIKKKQLEDFSHQLKTTNDNLELLSPLIKDNQSKIETHQELVKQYETDVKAYNALKTELAAYDSSLNEKNQTIKSMNEELETISKQISAFESSLTSSINSALDFSSNLGILNHHVSLLQSEITAKTATNSEIENLQNNFTLISTEITKAETNKASSKLLEKNVLSSETCPVCLQPIAEQHKNHFRNKISTESAESERIIAEQNQKKEILSKQLISQKEKLNVLLEKERKLAEFLALANQFSKEAQELGITATFEENPYNIESVLEALAYASKILKEKLTIQASISEKSSYMKTLQQRVALTSAEVEELLKKILTIKSNLQKYSSLEADFSSIKSRFEKLQQQEKELLVKKASFDKEIENFNNNILLLKQEITKKEEDKKSLDYSMQLKNWINDYFLNLMGVIEKNVMLKVYNEFNSLFQNWFNTLMEDESISARLDDAFTPVVEINGYEIPLENLSGGEKTSCALAYRLALNKVINDVITTIKTRDLLILDEPTDGFSSEQLEKVRDVLEQLQLPQTIIVSHESKIESFVQNVTRIVKEQHVSHVIS